MIFRLQYCNDSGDTAIIDIETKTGVGIQEIEGSGNPFSLQYKTEKTDKSGRFMTSSANIEIYENEFFNIDILKTSNETDIKVSYYVNEVLTWQGFILPDFFSKEIKDNAVISMTASDRINTLKAVTLSDLPDQIELRELAELCLAKTGLTLPLYTMADFIHADENNDTLFRIKIQSQRLDDEKGRSISCYDILESILILSNSQIVQRKGAWQIINKYQLEQGVGKNYSTLSNFTNWAKTIHNFKFIGKGAIRTIAPVASSVGVFQEYGGGKRYPDNYDFRESGAWIARNGFTFIRDNREIKWFEKAGDDVIPVWGAVTNQYYLFNKNSIAVSDPTDLIGSPYLESTKTNVPLTTQTAEINIDVNGTSPLIPFTDLPYNQQVALNYVVIAESDTSTLVLNNKGVFVPLANNKDNFQRLSFQRTIADVYSTVTKSSSVKGVLDVGLYGNVSNYKISVRIYGSGLKVPILVNYISYTFKSTQDSPKGTLYKTTQGNNFTREHDVETTVFGDYLTKGLNGYFYDYQNDDTGSLIAQGGAKTELWTAPNETESLPLLQQISRQKARQFSIAHDIIRGDIEIKNFDPLTIFKDCNNHEYVVVSAEFDFLRSIASIEIEQILYGSNISRRDYIYSYFGEGESSIKSVGGISGGSGGGGGMTSEQLEMLTNLANWWKLDEDNDAIYSEKSVYSLKGVSALGLGSGGGGGGGVDMLDSWANYAPAKANYYVPASLLVPFRNDTLSRLASLEAGGGGGGDVEISITGLGNAVTGVSKSGNTLTFAKSSTFALATHNHDTLYKPIGYVPSWGDITGKPTTFAPGAHTHTIANITGLQSALNSKQDTLIAGTNITISGNTISASGGMSSVAWGDITGKPTTFAPGAHTHSASDITSGTLTIARIPTGTTGTTVALGNHLHTGVYEPVFAKNNAFNKNFGTAVGTVAQGNDSRILNGQTAFGWGNHTSAGYALNSALTAHINKVDNPHAVTKSQVGLGSVDNTADSAKNVLSATKLTTARTIWGQSFNGEGNVLGALTGATTGSFSASVSTPKVDFGNGFTIEPSGTELVFKHNGVIKQRMLSDGTILATGGITALATN